MMLMMIITIIIIIILMIIIINNKSHLMAAGCQNMRNRNLSLLARRHLKLKSIAIGHASAFAYGKPRITNQVKPCPC